jgi:hypothetical protein
MEQFDDVPFAEDEFEPVIPWEFFDGFEDVFEDEVITNEAGGKQSKIATRLDLVPADVMLLVGEVLAEGAEKYGEDNWKLIPECDHTAHALEHVYNHLANPDIEELTHAICRLMFATHMNLQETE